MDYSEKLAEEFKSFGSVKVKEIMSRDIIAINEDDGFLSLMDKIKSKDYFGFPVVNDHNELVGVITWSDLLKLISFYGSRGAKMVETEVFTGIPSIRSIMSTHPLTLTPEDTIEDAISLMTEYGIQRIPIVEDKTIVGIVGKKDIMKRIFKMFDDLRGLK